MEKYNKTLKILITILALGFIVWFGGSIIRSAIGYDLFHPDAQLVLKENYSNEIKMHSVYLFSTLSLYTDVGYVAAFFASLSIMIYLRKQLKQHGWLFMSLVLFLVASPVQFYMIYSDIQLSLAVIYSNIKDFANPIVQEFFYDRFKSITLTTASSLAYLANITALLYVIWRPLDSSK